MLIISLAWSINPLGLVLLLSVSLLEQIPLSWRPIHRLLLYFKQFSYDNMLYNTELEQ